ncbi:MAG: hypothetical protein V3W28_01500 [Thermoplasmata archaeon]
MAGIDPKKLLAFVARESGTAPLPAPGPEEGELAEEEMYDEEEEELEEGPGITDEEIEEIAEMIEAGEGEPDLMDLAHELAEEIEDLGPEAEQPPKWAANPAIWEKAEKAVDPEGKGAKYREPWGVVVHVYRKMGGAVA